MKSRKREFEQDCAGRRKIVGVMGAPFPHEREGRGERSRLQSARNGARGQVLKSAPSIRSLHGRSP